MIFKNILPMKETLHKKVYILYDHFIYMKLYNRLNYFVEKNPNSGCVWKGGGRY